jgi:hypothetical protein
VKRVNKLFVSSGIALTGVLLVAPCAAALADADAAASARDCAIVGKYPSTMLQATSVPAPRAMAFDLFDSRTLLGRQVVFENPGSADDPLLTGEPFWLSNGRQPTVRCSAPADVSLTPTTVVDVGPQIILHAIYLGRGSLTAAFYVYEEDYFASRKDEGLMNQLIAVQLDERAPYQIQVTAKPGQYLTVRFDGIAPGHHRVRFGEMERGGVSTPYQVTPLWILEYTQPNALGTQAS